MSILPPAAPANLPHLHELDQLLNGCVAAAPAFSIDAALRQKTLIKRLVLAYPDRDVDEAAALFVHVLREIVAAAA